MFPAPKEMTATVFARLPDAMHREGEPSSWSTAQARSISPHSSLEGPAVAPDGTLYCVDTAHGRIFHVDNEGTFRTIADYDGEPNGAKFDANGMLLVADYRLGLVRVDLQAGSVTTVLSRSRAEHFKAINDLTIARDGTVYFTDQALTGLTDPTGRVYRWRQGGEPEAILTNGPSPNGLVLSADESELFVAMTRANAIWRVPLRAGPSLDKVGVFVQLSGGTGPDGLAMDEAGNLVVAHVGLGSVWLFSPYGEPILRIRSPQGRKTTNIAFGGADGRTLFVTEAETGTILQAPMPAAGLHYRPVSTRYTA